MKKTKNNLELERHLKIKNQLGEIDGEQSVVESESIEEWFRDMCGQAQLYDQFLAKYETIAIIHLIRVEPQNRGKSYGKKLLEEWLNSIQAEVVVCWASGFGNDPVDYLHAFYQSCGFKPYGGHLMVWLRN
jgi:GNAT superfamily N-acetyltransferase